jgi:hypothetical protein
VQLIASDVDSNDAPRPTRQKDLCKPARRGPDIKTGAPVHSDAKHIQRVRQLDPAPGDPGVSRLRKDDGVRPDGLARLEGADAPDADLSSLDGCTSLRSRGRKPAAEHLNIKPPDRLRSVIVHGRPASDQPPVRHGLRHRLSHNRMQYDSSA